MDDNLTDQQQADLVRRWWKENGAFVIVGLFVGVGGLFGWQQWQSYTLQRAEKASAVYEELLNSVRGDRINEAGEYLGLLIDDYSATPYVDQARLAMAKVHMDRNMPDAAANELQNVIDETEDVQLGHIARLRLVRIRLHQGEFETALAILQEPELSAFTPRYQNVRGDVYFAMGRLGDARDEYQKSLDSAEPGVINRAYVQAKLDNLGLSGTDEIASDSETADQAVGLPELGVEAATSGNPE